MSKDDWIVKVLQMAHVRRSVVRSRELNRRLV
jgi:hypothetical protein